LPEASFFVIVRYLAEGGQAGVDVVGVRDAEAGVEGQGVAPVAAGLVKEMPGPWHAASRGG